MSTPPVQDVEAEALSSTERSTVQGLPEDRPTLPPRPKIPVLKSSPSIRHLKSHLPNRPGLLSRPTTAVSSIDIQTLSFPDGSRGTFDTSLPSGSTTPSVSDRSSIAPASRKVSQYSNDLDDTTSLMSYAPTLRATGDLASLLGDAMNSQSPAWKLLNSQTEGEVQQENMDIQDDGSLVAFREEFDEVDNVDTEAGNEDAVIAQWKSKMKHYMILSSAGKPIWSRHGDRNLVNGYIGIIQTIISFYEGNEDPLQSFSAGSTKFVIMTQGPLYLVAISRLNESDIQLQGQLYALYMQILSTLTLPNLEHIFKSRASSDLQRPLQGTEPLLASLADTFTRGSPSALLSALECLKVRKAQRHAINNTLLKTRTDKLLYGLIVAGGRLVSVVRPKRHSLHPSDLQLIFNMLFEADAVKAGGGENWIPLCLPGFNNRGYLYMYVSFIDVSRDERPGSGSSKKREEEVAIILVSADKESFFDLQKMRDELVSQLESNGSMKVIKTAVQEGRPSITDIVPGTQIKHFLYKSRHNVQFVMPSLSPHFDDLVARRRLMSLYDNLHASVHGKHTHLKILHCSSEESVSLAWISQDFEFYCIARKDTSRASLAQSANKVIQLLKREEERIFIIGGAVF